MSASSQWQFVGNISENYERYLVPIIFAPWALDLVEAAALQPRERVLDIACGTGIVARTAAQRLSDGANLVGLDLSAAMLEVARSEAKAEGVTAEWREGSAVKLPLADATFDVAFCQQGLQFFPTDQLHFERCIEYSPQMGGWCLASGAKSSEARDLPRWPMH